MSSFGWVGSTGQDKSSWTHISTTALLLLNAYKTGSLWETGGTMVTGDNGKIRIVLSQVLRSEATTGKESL